MDVMLDIKTIRMGDLDRTMTMQDPNSAYLDRRGECPKLCANTLSSSVI